MHVVGNAHEVRVATDRLDALHFAGFLRALTSAINAS